MTPLIWSWLVIAPIVFGPSSHGQELKPPRAVERLQERFAAMEREVDRLRTTGDAAKADQLAAKIQEYKAWLKGPYQPPKSEEPEVHMIGVYEGANPSGLRDVGHVSVKVTYTARPIILVLCAYDEVLWQVEVGKGVRLNKVILSGYYRQSAKGLPGGAPVFHLSHEDGASEYFKAHQANSGDYLRAAEIVKKLTEREVATFQGDYRPKGVFVIGPESENWRAEHLLKRTADLYAEATFFERQRVRTEMKKIRFAGVH